MSLEIKEIIADSIKAFSKGNLFDNAINLFTTLGYKTDRRDRLPDNSYSGFVHHFPNAKERINPNKMCAEHWDKIELLFQLTQTEMIRQSFLFGIGKVDDTIIEAYLFFAI